MRGLDDWISANVTGGPAKAKHGYSDAFTLEQGRNQEFFPNTERTVTVKFQLMNHTDVVEAGVSALRKLEKQI